MLHAADIKRAARTAGFDHVGITRAQAVGADRRAEVERWLAEGCHGEMDYLARNVDKRLDPRLLVEGAQTIVCVAVNYNPGFPLAAVPYNEAENPHHKAENELPANKNGEQTNDNETPNIPNRIPKKENGGQTATARIPLSNHTSPHHLARYAYGTDYHLVVKDMLRRTMQTLGLTEGTDGRCFADTAPVDEKYWAQQSGIGWRGKNCQLIIPRAGSFFFLGELVLTHPVDHYDTPHPSRCGTCHRCIDACPMHALRGDGTMDARRCLSYLTIEHRGALPPEAAAHLSPCFYGCDRCAEACPWNIRYATATPHPLLAPRPDILSMRAEDWAALTPDTYRRLFKDSAVKRAKYDGLRRNIDAAYTK